MKEKAVKANRENNTNAAAATCLVEDLTEVTDLLFKRENGTRNEEKKCLLLQKQTQIITQHIYYTSSIVNIIYILHNTLFWKFYWNVLPTNFADTFPMLDVISIVKFSSEEVLSYNIL